jgi:hypothetical protein
MKCPICDSLMSEFKKDFILNKYEVSYYQCSCCQFMCTQKPFWLDEAYSKAISDIDIGLVYRNILYAKMTKYIIDLFFNRSKYYLDFGGGYGLFVRLMRDIGYNFYREDRYCENLFAKNFDLANFHENGTSFDVLTAFEVLEHIENPKEALVKMFSLSDNILFSTELIPNSFNTKLDWWYFLPETGQHISFYSKESLSSLAKTFNKNYYYLGEGLHLFTSKKISIKLFNLYSKNRFLRALINIYLPIQRTSFLKIDFDSARGNQYSK